MMCVVTLKLFKLFGCVFFLKLQLNTWVYLWGVLHVFAEIFLPWQSILPGVGVIGLKCAFFWTHRIGGRFFRALRFCPGKRLTEKKQCPTTLPASGREPRGPPAPAQPESCPPSPPPEYPITHLAYPAADADASVESTGTQADPLACLQRGPIERLPIPPSGRKPVEFYARLAAAGPGSAVWPEQNFSHNSAESVSPPPP